MAKKYSLLPSIIRLTPDSPDSSYKFSDNPILGYELKPNFRSTNPNSSEVYSYVNAFGQRDKERTQAKPEGTKRIIILGDSVVAGNGIADLNNTITRHLEKILDPSKIEVLNFGVGGYSTKGEIELLKTKALNFSPDMVILFYVENDVIEINDQIEYYINDKITLWHKIYISSYILRYIGNCFDWDIETEIFKAHYKAVGKNSILKSITTLQELSQENNFQPCVLLWPTFYNDRYETLTELMDHVISASASNKIPLFDMKPYIEQYLSIEHKTDFRKTLTTGDGMHPNEDGALIAAKAIKTILTKNFPDLLTNSK